MQDTHASQTGFTSDAKSLLPLDRKSSETERQPRRPRWRFPNRGPAYEKVRLAKPDESEHRVVSHVDDQNMFALILLYVSLAVPIILLLSWWMFVYQKQQLSLIRSAPIGGRLDLIVAKGIDVLCSAILAPLGMACMNLLWLVNFLPFIFRAFVCFY